MTNMNRFIKMFQASGVLFLRMYYENESDKDVDPDPGDNNCRKFAKKVLSENLHLKI